MPVIVPIDLEPILFRDLGNNNEPWVVAQIARAQDAVEGALGRPIEEEAGIVETIDGSRSRFIFLSRWPVSAIASITEDGTALVADDDFGFTEAGMVGRRSSGYSTYWIWKPSSIVVTYTGGFPVGSVGYRDLAGVVLRVAARMFQAAATDASRPDSTDSLSSESIGTYEATYSEDSAESVSDSAYLNDQDLEVIARYRTPTLA